LRRQRALIEFALASLLRRRGKTAAVGSVLVLVVFLVSSLGFLAASVRHELSQLLRGAPDVIVQRVVAARHDLVPEAALATVRAIDGVKEARGRLWGYYYDPAAGANYTVTVAPDVPHRQGEAVIGAGISRARQAFRNDILSLRSYTGESILFTVAGVLPEASELMTSDLMLVSDPDYRALFALPPGVVNDIAVRLAADVDAGNVRRELARLLPDARIVIRADLLATATSFFEWDRGVAAVVLVAMAVALLIIALDKPSALSAEERKEMGILRALGWTAPDVLMAKVWESLAVTITSVLVGGVAGYAHVYLFRSALFAPVLRGWAVLAPRLDVVPSVDPPMMLVLAASTIALPAAGALIACYRPVMSDPDVAMRE
jgi:ABC-type lipoprotein release transport system permease subunit